MARTNESKIKSLIKKLEKQGYNLSDVTDKSMKQLTNNKAFEKFEKLVKRKLERKKILEENRKYDERIAKKREQKNEEIFKKYPWVKKVMKFDDKYKNIKDAKTVLDRKLNEERLEIKNTISKYFNIKNRNIKKILNPLLKEIDKENNIHALKSFNEKIEYILEAYGSEDDNNSFIYSEEEIIEKIHSRFRIEKLSN